MKFKRPFVSLVLVALASISLTGIIAADETERIYQLESLKYVYTVTVTTSGDQVSDTLNSQEYEDGRGETIAFSGTAKRGNLKVKLEEDPELLATADPDGDGVLEWKTKVKKLLIPIYSADDDGNPVVVDMPLKLRK